MLPKYTVEYSAGFRRQVPNQHYSTDDPVACEEFVSELLERGYRLAAIKHEGVDLPRVDFDRMVKTGGSLLAARHICRSLGLKGEEERHRFGFTA